MKLRQSRREEPEVNLAPLIDVVFLLLLFFMVASTFRQESAITIDLPAAASSPSEAERKPIELTVDAQGRYYVNQQLVVNKQIGSLKKALQRALGDAKQPPPLLISADANSTHQAVVTAMDAARQVGIEQVSLATRHAEEQP